MKGSVVGSCPCSARKERTPVSKRKLLFLKEIQELLWVYRQGMSDFLR
jgi:hypothetical protein